MHRTLVPIVLLCVAAAARGQDNPKPRRRFEVASIKPNKSGERPPQLPVVFSPGGRLTVANGTLVDMIVQAYRTRRVQMQGGPDWIDTERFDIVAKADTTEGEVSREDLAPMLQVLLEERFHLTMHQETKDIAVLVLLPGKKPANLETAKDGDKTGLKNEEGKFIFTRMPIIGLVNTLSNILHQPMVDKTGLEGLFNFTLDPFRYMQTVDPTTPVRTDSIGDLLLVAVRDQLGFQLEKRKEPTEITVIDRAERPAEN